MFVVLVDFLEAFALEERSSEQEDVENDSQREHIADGRNLLAHLKSGYLRGHVAWSAATVKNVVIPGDFGGKSKVGQNRLTTFSKHDVCRFDVPMHDSL